jgi:hypothetical protein
MKNTAKKYLQFYNNNIVWLVEESFYTIKLFLLLVKNRVKRVSVTKNEKTKTPFFLGKNGKGPKNNDLTPVFVTILLPCNQNSEKIPLKAPKYPHRQLNHRLYFKLKIPP